MKHWLLLGVLAGCAIESPPPERYEGAPQSPAVAEDPPAVARVVQAAVFGPFDSGAGTTLPFETKHPGDTLLFTVEFEGPGYPGVVHVGEDTAYQWGVSSHGCTDGERLVFAASIAEAPAGQLMVDGDLHNAVVAAIELAGNVSQWPVANSQPFGMAGETPIADVAAEPGDFVVSVIASCGPAAMLVGPFTALPSVGGVVTAYSDVATAGTVGPRWDVGGMAWTALTDAYR